MYRLWKYLFGWDYVLWTNSADSGIARVRVDKEGKVWYWRYKSTRVADSIDYNHVRWLTCHPSKYIKALNKENEEKLK